MYDNDYLQMGTEYARNNKGAREKQNHDFQLLKLYCKLSSS
jgi:hypothetical protein